MADIEARCVELRTRGVPSGRVARMLGIGRGEVNRIMRRHARASKATPSMHKGA